MTESDLPTCDDTTIPDHEELYRRVPLLSKFVVRIPGSNRLRPSSAAFRVEDHRISVDLSSLATPEQTLARAPDPAGFGVVALLAGAARARKQGVVRDPIPEAPGTLGNPAHALIVGNQTPAVCKELACAATWKIGGEAGARI